MFLSQQIFCYILKTKKFLRTERCANQTNHIIVNVNNTESNLLEYFYCSIL